MGGTVELQGSEFSDPYEWAEYDSAAWAAVKDWGANVAIDAYFYRAREIGNGVAYVGESEWSNIVDLT